MNTQDFSNYSKAVLSNWTKRPQVSIYIEPLDLNIDLKVSVSSTTISIQYDSGSLITVNVGYENKSVQQVVDELNRQNMPIIIRALSSNLQLVTGSLLDTGGYQEIPNGFKFHDRGPNNSVLIRSNSYTIRHKSAEKIALKPPYLEAPYLPWYPRIKNGVFQQRFNNKVFHFSIPEYENQSWSLRYGKPFKDVRGASPIVIDNKTIRLTRSPVLYNQNISLFLGETPISSSLIEDIDIYNGLVYFKENQIITPEDIKVDYTYLEEHFEYKGININGHFSQNPSLIDKFVVIYLIPTEGSIAISTKQSVFHSVGESLEEAIDNIKVNPNIPISILGAYNIQQVSASNDSQILDTRVKGGGIVSNEGPQSPIYDLDNLKIFSNQISPVDNNYIDRFRFWDIDSNWDGEPYPGSAAVVVELPEKYRDILPLKDIKSKSKKYMAAGIYPIFDFYTETNDSSISSNVSCLNNGNFKDSVSGAYWTLTEYSTPNNSVFSFYDGDVANNPTIYIDRGKKNVRVNVATGIYQSYLKSTQVATLSWEEREIEYIPGRSGIYQYGPWETVTIEDTREVPTGELIKGYFSLDVSDNLKEYRNISIYSPYRLDNITGLKKDVENTISRIYNSIETNTLQLSATGVNIPSRYYSSITKKEKDFIFPYVAVHKSATSLQKLAGTDLSGISATSLSNNIPFIEQSFTGFLPDVYFPSFNAILNSEAIFNQETLINSVSLKPILDYYSDYVWSSRNNVSYSTRAGTLEGFCSGLAYKQKYLCASYYYTAGDPQISPFLYVLGENYGYSERDIDNRFNSDHLLNSMLPTAMKINRAFSRMSSTPITGSLSGLFSNLEEHVDKVYNRLLIGASGDITYSGFSIFRSPYYTFDRLGEFAGSVINDYFDAYETLLETLKYNSNVSNTSTVEFYFNGPGALNKIFQICHSGLDLLYNQVNESLANNGIIESSFSNIIRAYGRYYNLVNEYETIYNKEYSSYSAKYSGLYDRGVKTLLSNSIDEFGFVHETTYIDQKAGSFIANVPSSYFTLLKEGLTIDENRYKSYIHGMLLNLNSKYEDISGVYYEDSTKAADLGGKEFDLINDLTNIYVAL